MMSQLQRKTPAAALTAGRGDAAVFGDAYHNIQTSSRLQLRRLGETSGTVAFVEKPDGTPLGCLSRGLAGWNVIKHGPAQALNFPSALRAARILIGAWS